MTREYLPFVSPHFVGVTLLAHLVFGVVLGLLARRLSVARYRNCGQKLRLKTACPVETVAPNFDHYARKSSKLCP